MKIRLLSKILNLVPLSFPVNYLTAEAYKNGGHLMGTSFPASGGYVLHTISIK
jgi:hypothetical protein